MLGRLLPAHGDNTFHGSKFALWIFVPLVLLESVIGVNSIFMGRTVASKADGIPLDTFPAAAAQTVVGLFAMLGLAHLVLCVLCVIVLFRYRSLIPLMFSLLLLDQLGRKAIRQFLPIPTIGAPPGSIVTIVLLILMVVGLALSLRGHDKS
jgi:hypothetical protein